MEMGSALKELEMTKLVKMVKPGEDPIEVSPLVVEDHKSLGWKVAGEDLDVDAEEQAGEASPKKPRRSSRSKNPAATEPIGE